MLSSTYKRFSNIEGQLSSWNVTRQLKSGTCLRPMSQIQMQGFGQQTNSSFITTLSCYSMECEPNLSFKGQIHHNSGKDLMLVHLPRKRMCFIGFQMVSQVYTRLNNSQSICDSTALTNVNHYHLSSAVRYRKLRQFRR